MTPAEFLQAQLTGIEMWHNAQRAREDACRVRGPLRDQRVEVARREQAMSRQVEALRRRTEQSLAASREVLAPDRPRLLVAQRQAWTRAALCSALSGLRAEAHIAQASDGAEAVGIAIADQPHVLLIDDRLPLMNADEVIPAVREFSPGTLVAVQVSNRQEVAAALEAGAGYAFVRTGALDTARTVLDLLDGGLQGRRGAHAGR